MSQSTKPLDHDDLKKPWLVHRGSHFMDRVGVEGRDAFLFLGGFEPSGEKKKHGKTQEISGRCSHVLTSLLISTTFLIFPPNKNERCLLLISTS